MTRPLFVPLKGEWFRAFRDGGKRIEWRVYGARWNRQTAYRGRPVTMSNGYSGARLAGSIVRARRVCAANAPACAREIYPDAKFFLAIHVCLDRDGIARKRSASSQLSIGFPA